MQEIVAGIDFRVRKHSSTRTDFTDSASRQRQQQLAAAPEQQQHDSSTHQICRVQSLDRRSHDREEVERG
jgi:hypothetical protein